MLKVEFILFNGKNWKNQGTTFSFSIQIISTYIKQIKYYYPKRICWQFFSLCEVSCFLLDN